MFYSKILQFVLICSTASLIAYQAVAGDSPIKQYQKQAKLDDPAFTQFSMHNGEQIYRSATGGKADTPSCTTCHSQSPQKTGETRSGKSIKPMAISVTPSRYQEFKKTEKWFRRNCKSVIGRECTAREKGDFLTYMLNQ